ncbi:MAG: hypothetical protein ABS36_10675 [Acidobacteria bacterium SCN 69-37]|nr:MAG: hypothetical protein ABS36_10675 [Acidobacteria bacterium SCN 69-37]
MSESPRAAINYVNVATGLCVAGLGGLLLVQRAGLIDARQVVALWPLALVVIGLAVVWQASRDGSVRGSGACAGWLFWLIVIGLLVSHAYDRRAAAEARPEAGMVNTFAVMGGDERRAEGDPFRGGSVTAVFGGSRLDLTHATIGAGETAVIDVFTVMGGTEIRVPAGWSVEFRTTVVAGGVNDQRPRPAADPGTAATAAPDGPDAPPRLVVQGSVFLGGVTVK